MAANAAPKFEIYETDEFAVVSGQYCMPRPWRGGRLFSSGVIFLGWGARTWTT